MSFSTIKATTTTTNNAQARTTPVKGGEKVYHCGGGIVYHPHDEVALGGQPARALRLGDPDVAEDRWVHVATSPRGNKTPGCLPVSLRQSIRIWGG